MPEGSLYIHGVSRAEQKRLSTLNRLLNPGSLRELAIRPGERTLDVGCGLGEFTRAIGRAAGVPAVGIERSPEQLAEARRAAEEAGEAAFASFRQGEAERLPLQDGEWGSFQVVHARFLLEHLQDPAPAVSEMVRAARPGGRIVLEDDDHGVLRLWPEPAGFSELWAAYIRSYDRNGNDPFVGRRLVSLLAAAGARPVRNSWQFFGACSGEPDFVTYVENLAGVLESAKEAVQEAGALTPGQFERTIHDVRAWGTRPDAALWYSVSWAQGVKPV
jgi:ubiquinone/menaquinone biosynthesis C-methylase UbiE